MDPLIIAIIVAVFTLIVLFSGIPIAFGLSFVSIALLVAFEGLQMLDVFAETFYAGTEFICSTFNTNVYFNGNGSCKFSSRKRFIYRIG